MGVRAPAMITDEPMRKTVPRALHRATVTDMTLPHHPSIIGVDHVGLAVPDLAAAIALHTDVLGGSVAHREVNAEQGVEEVMISYGSGAQIQLLAPLDATSTIAKFIERNGPGLQQLAYRVTDVDEVSAAIRSHGLRLLYDTRATRNGRLTDQFRASEGHRRGADRVSRTSTAATTAAVT